MVLPDGLYCIFQMVRWSLMNIFSDGMTDFSDGLLVCNGNFC